MQIEGIPDGWYFVRVGRVKLGEFYVNNEGFALEWTTSGESGFANYVVISKIEKPKRYRHFANAAEAESLWNAALRRKSPMQNQENSRYQINAITGVPAIIVTAFYSYEEAFDVFECVDGTPFGVEVTDD